MYYSQFYNFTILHVFKFDAYLDTRQMRSGTLQSLDRPENIKFRNHWCECILKQTHYNQASRDVVLSNTTTKRLEIKYCQARVKTYCRPYSAS